MSQEIAQFKGVDECSLLLCRRSSLVSFLLMLVIILLQYILDFEIYISISVCKKHTFIGHLNGRCNGKDLPTFGV